MIESRKLPVFITSPTWRMNGVNIFAMNLIRGLNKLGQDASVVLTNPKKIEPVPLRQPPDIVFQELPVEPSDSIVGRWKKLIRFLRSHGPCVYIPNYDTHTSCVSPCLGSHVGIIGIIHSDDPQHYEHFDRIGATWNAVVAVSQAIEHRILEKDPTVYDRLLMIPYGVDLPKPRRGPGSDTGPLRVLYAGRLTQYQKRVFDVPSIVRETIARNVRVTLSFAGGGDDEAALKETCRDLESAGLVRFLGLLDHKELAAEFDRHDVLLMTSEFEGLPIALLEAMAHGVVPVVSAIASGIPEVIRNGHNGLIASVGDIKGLAAHLQTLAGDRILLSKLSAAARATIEDGPFLIDRMCEAYADVIDRVAAEARDGSFARRKGRIITPPDLEVSWRDYLPSQLRAVGRKALRALSHG